MTRVRDAADSLHTGDRTMHRLVRFVVAVVALAGCASDGAVQEDGRDDSFTSDGKLDGIQCTPAEAAAILHVVNTSSRADLQDEVGLSAKASDNIVAYREGDDETEGTADDETFGTLAELDAVPYVGPAAFQHLLTYVHDADLVDDVPYRQWHSETIANGASSDFTIAPDGRPVVVYYAGSPPYTLRLGDGSTVALPNDPIYTSADATPQVAVDADGRVHVFYSGAYNQYKHASYSNGQWTQYDPLTATSLQVDQGPGGQVYALGRKYLDSYRYELTLYTVTSSGATTAEVLWNTDDHVHLNVDSEGFPAIAWEQVTVRTGRRTTAGWQTRDVGFSESIVSLATTGGANTAVMIERPLIDKALQTFRQQGSSFVEGDTFPHGSTVYKMDAVVDALGTAHFCAIADGNVVHLQLATTGTLEHEVVGSADDCSLALDSTGTLHLLTSLGSVINHATFE